MLEQAALYPPFHDATWNSLSQYRSFEQKALAAATDDMSEASARLGAGSGKEKESESE
jgi:hypothetical protein